MFARVSATISTERHVGVGAVWVLFVVLPTDRPALQSEWPALGNVARFEICNLLPEILPTIASSKVSCS